MRWVPSMLRQRWFFAAVVGLGVALGLPSLWVGFLADDYTFIYRLEQPATTATWRLYEFARGEAGQRETFMHTRWAAFPWWLTDDFKVRFLRPLSSGLFALDHALFGRAPLGYHVHCLLWYALLLVAVGLFLRRVCSAPVWQLAFLLFAVSAGHAESMAWISSRHVLVSGAPALLGLVALIEHRERKARFARPLGLLGIGVGFLGGEGAVSVVCYWLAFEAFGASAPVAVSARMRRLALPLLCVAAYAALFKWLGYGVGGSAAYLDPISTPRAFWLALPGRLAMLLGEALAGFPANLALTTLPGPGIALGAGFTACVGLMLRSLWPNLEPTERRAVVWLGAGALLGLLASSGAFLGSRLLLIPGIGTSVVIATLLRHGWQRARSSSGTLARRALYSYLLLVHVGVALVGLQVNCLLLRKLGAGTAEAEVALDTHFEQHRARGAGPPKVFILAASDPFSGFYAAAVRVVRAPDSTGQWSILSLARATHRVERTGPGRLVMQMEPSLLRSTFEGLFRGHDRPFFVGDRAKLQGAVVTVLAVESGRPTSIALELDHGSFDDSDVCLIAWREGRLVPVHLAPHEKLSIPWSPGPSSVL